MSDAQGPSEKEQQTTPPNSFIASPPTPPPTNERAAPYRVLPVLGYFKQIQTGRTSKPPNKRTFQLSKGELGEIWRQLKQDQALLDYVTHQLRYEYEAATGRLSIRMPTSTHEVFIRKVSKAIESQLDDISQHGETEVVRNFGKQIESMGSTTLEFPDLDARGSKYSPDASYKHRGAKWPGVIVEAAYAQSSRSLSRRADNYVQWSNGSIQLIIGLKIEYGEQSRKASLSTWRAEIVDREDGRYLETKQDLREVAFRDDLGNPISDPNQAFLEISLHDFANSALTQPLGDVNETITITSRFLYDALVSAEQSNGDSEETLPPGVRKRKRSSTPGYQITAADEVVYQETEERMAKRLDKEDVDFEATSTTSTTSSL